MSHVQAWRDWRPRRSLTSVCKQTSTQLVENSDHAGAVAALECGLRHLAGPRPHLDTSVSLRQTDRIEALAILEFAAFRKAPTAWATSNMLEARTAATVFVWWTQP
jgi:hypothetical protein